MSGTDLSGGAERPRPSGSARPVHVLGAVIRGWALAGGLLTAALSVMTAASAVSNLAFGRPLAADYELTKHFIAVAIFMFLPYCQLVGANVTVDIFTERMSERKKAAMAALSSLFAVAFSLLLTRQMWLGFVSYIQYREVTPVLQLPLWTAYPPMLLSLLLLLIAAVITFVDGWRGARGLPPLSHRRQQVPVE